jgi:tetratricopeptide (TPR) repeat protein
MEQEKWGNITFGDTTKLHIGIMGQSAMLGIIPQKEYDGYKRKLERVYKDEVPFSRLSISSPESPQYYFELFLNDLKDKCKLPSKTIETNGKKREETAAEFIIDSFTWQLFYSVLSFTPFEYPQHDILLHLVRSQVFNFVYDCVTDKNAVFNFSKDAVLSFITDTYKKIFKDAAKNLSGNNIEKLSNEITSYCSEKYGNLFETRKGEEKEPNFYQEINRWMDEKTNPTWRMLEPILDFMYSKNQIMITHRLIAHYFFKNTQRALAEVCGISLEEQKKIIIDVAIMLIENRKPSAFYDEYYGQKYFLESMPVVFTCLEYLNGEKIEFDTISHYLNEIKRNLPHSHIFFSLWFEAKAKCLLLLQNGSRDANSIGEITDKYSDAFDKGKYFAGGFMRQFLLEAIVVERYFYPRNKKWEYYHGFGYALEMFNFAEDKDYNDGKERFLNQLKTEFKTNELELREQFLIINWMYNPSYEIERQNFIQYQQHIERINESILINNEGLEHDKNGRYKDALDCFYKAIELNPHYANAYSNRGNVYQHMKEYDLAIIEFNKTLKINPHHLVTLFNRASIYANCYDSNFSLDLTNILDVAIEDLTILLSINPDDKEAFALREKVKARKKKYA